MYPQLAQFALTIIARSSGQLDDQTQQAVAVTKQMLHGIASGELVVTPKVKPEDVPPPPPHPPHHNPPKKKGRRYR